MDTRNSYEVKLDTFRGAVDPGIQRFRDSLGAAAEFADSIKASTVVTFCTAPTRATCGEALDELNDSAPA